MYYYTISIIVFLLVSAYIAYLIGKFSNQSKMEGMLKDIDELKKSNKDKTLGFKELEEQLYHQSSVVKDMLSNEQKLQDRIQIFETEKKRLATESNLLSKRVDKVIANENSKESLYSEIAVLDSEALRWKNKYTIIHNELSSQLGRLIDSREKDQNYIEEILSQKYKLIQQIETNLLDFQSNLASIRNTPVDDSSDKQEIIELELKNKRQENIIKALRFQLQNLNLQKINDKKENNQLTESIVESSEEITFENEIETHEEIVDENNYHEILDEANQDIFELFDKLKEFKEEKVRKTGNEQLNYSEISRRIDKTIETRTKNKSTEILDASYQESDTENNTEDTTLYLPEDRSDMFNIIGVSKEEDARLTMIFNINRNTQNKLYSFGINSFEQMALLTDDHFSILEQYLGLEEHSIREEKWVEQAQVLTNESDIRSLYISSSANVNNIQEEEEEKNFLDLTIVKGIGKTYRQRLQKAGIEDLQDLANWKEDDIDELAQILSIKSSLIIKQQWLKQARNKLAKTL